MWERVGMEITGISGVKSKPELTALGWAWLTHSLGSLVCLRLSWNALGDGGAQALASILPGMEKLKVLE